MLYILAGFAGKGLGPGERIHAGGLRYAIEAVEFGEGILEEYPLIQYRRGGVFINNTDEFLYPVEYRISPMCLEAGITWDWFPEYWAFGNGITSHKTIASPEYRVVVHGTNLTMEQFLALHGPTRLADLELHRLHNRHEGWEKYESRWMPGTCPQENHIVHLTWIVTTHKLPEHVYERIRALVEYGVEPKNLHMYHTESGKHFSTIRPYDGSPTVIRAG